MYEESDDRARAEYNTYLRYIENEKEREADYKKWAKEEEASYNENIASITKVEELRKRVESYQKKYETPGFEQLCELCSEEVNERKRKRS